MTSLFSFQKIAFSYLKKSQFTYYLLNSMVMLMLSMSAAIAKPPPIQLATNYRQDIDVTQYYVSEKLDGIRAYWDGHQLISKQGNVFTAPTWFIKSFPTTAMDGELWIARQQFEKVSGIARTQDNQNEQWKKIKFMIFDLPNNRTSFEQRINEMRALVADTSSPYLQMIEQQKLPNTEVLFDLLNKVVMGKGEGLMLHHQDALYQTKRSRDLMKLKKFEDAEATVIAYLPGKGKYEGLLGAILVKNEEGVTFKIGTGFSDKERSNPPPIGSLITYRFTGKTNNNIPRFASFVRIRVIY
ncbi:DNA ligase [uncultured Psychromonas sp.]|uniref:DNA ligase n=1 Tax=uncultured Psychromonas sp. TaxID=173974 RepID=UPI0026053419|nr:DNA ligase [uncultured Psychromonas sp.]